jgi:hypothetical protein
MRRALVTALMTALVAVPAPAAFAQDEDEESSSSLVRQVVTAADDSLGVDAAVAVVRSYDRGYDVLQIIEALFEGFVADDGTITDDDGASLAPFREPTNLIEENGTTSVRLVALDGAVVTGPAPSGEAIALDVLERGIQKTTKRLDKRLDLDARAERVGASEDSLMTMLAALFLMSEGYSPDQIIIDGFAAGGIQWAGPSAGLVLVDEKGKRIKPDGVEESPEHEEAAEQIDGLEQEILEAVGGLDVHTAATTSFKTMFLVKVEIILGEDTVVTISGKGRLGRPNDRGLRGVLVGHGTGKVSGGGACSVEGLEAPHPYELDGNVDLGFSGSIDQGSTRLHVGVTQANVSVSGDDSLCVDIVRDTSDILELLTLPLVELRLRDGAVDTGRSSYGGDPLEVTVSLSA